MAKLICPACEKDMSFMNFSKAPTPWHIKCQYCKAPLKLGRSNLTCLVLSIVAGVVLGVSAVLLFQVTGIALIGISVFLIGIVLFEWLVFVSLPKFGVSLAKK